MVFNGVLVCSESHRQQGHRLELHKFNYYQIMVPKRLGLPSSGMNTGFVKSALKHVHFFLGLIFDILFLSFEMNVQ